MGHKPPERKGKFAARKKNRHATPESGGDDDDRCRIDATAPADDAGAEAPGRHRISRHFIDIDGTDSRIALTVRQACLGKDDRRQIDHAMASTTFSTRSGPGPQLTPTDAGRGSSRRMKSASSANRPTDLWGPSTDTGSKVGT